MALPETAIRAIADLPALHAVDRGFYGQNQLARLRARVDAVARHEELVAESQLGTEPMQLGLVARDSARLVADDGCELTALECLEHGLIARALIVVT